MKKKILLFIIILSLLYYQSYSKAENPAPRDVSGSTNPIYILKKESIFKSKLINEGFYKSGRVNKVQLKKVDGVYTAIEQKDLNNTEAWNTKDGEDLIKHSGYIKRKD